MADSGFLIPAAVHRTETVISRSRFIASVAHAPTAPDARTFIDAIRAEFPDATHNCWAYLAGPPGSTLTIGMSDAGEPHGTAGRPMLDVLLHSGVGEIVAVVTRYYGGVKLGTGGLARAYSGSVQQALASLPTTRRVLRTSIQIRATYADVEALRRTMQEFGAELVSESYAEQVVYEAAVPRDVLESFRALIVDRTAGRALISQI